jgi:hypothetical protein
MVKGQPRVISTRSVSLGLSIPRVSKLRCHASAPPGLHYASGVPLCHVLFGTSRIAEYSTPSPLLLNPRMSNPRYSRFVPPVPLGIDGPDQIGGSHFADSTCMRSLRSPTPILPMRDDQEFFLCLRVNYPAPSLRSDDPWNFANLRDDLSRRFSSSMKSLLATTFTGGLEPSTGPKCYPSRALVNSSSFRVFASTFPALDLRLLLPSDEVSQFWALTLSRTVTSSSQSFL